MSIKDFIKDSVLNNFLNTDLSMKNVIILLLLSAFIGIYIFFIYRIVTTNTFYSKSFNISLIVMCLITTAIIVTIQSSIVVSLGMVGALSIVRFRTAVKEPLDLIFMFWSISIGIICGAGMPLLAVALSLVATIVILIFGHIPEMRKSMILSINAEPNSNIDEIYSVVKKYDRKCAIISRNLSKSNTDFLFEIRIKEYEELIRTLNEIKGVSTVSVIAHKGDAVY